MNEIQSHIFGRGRVITYAWMWKNAQRSLQAGRASEDGQFFDAMNTLVFSAFAMEAFFNHLGSHFFDDWPERERKLSKLKKLNLFRKKCEISNSLEKRPYKTVIELFGFRDLLAHGKTETLEVDQVIKAAPEDASWFKTENEWMELCNIEFAEKAFFDVEAAITELHQAAGLGKYAFLHFKDGVYSVRAFT